MCQQGPAEIYHCRQEELIQIKKALRLYINGELELTEDEVKTLMVRAVMLSED